MGCLKQQPHEKPWKKVLHFLHPSIVPIPNLIPLSSHFPHLSFAPSLLMPYLLSLFLQRAYAAKSRAS